MKCARRLQTERGKKSDATITAGNTGETGGVMLIGYRRRFILVCMSAFSLCLCLAVGVFNATAHAEAPCPNEAFRTGLAASLPDCRHGRFRRRSLQLRRERPRPRRKVRLRHIADRPRP